MPRGRRLFGAMTGSTPLGRVSSMRRQVKGSVRGLLRTQTTIDAPSVTEAICSCAGGRTNPRDKFEYVVESAKSDSPGHGDELTGMLDAWIKYGNPMEVKAGFNDADWEASLEFLSRDLMKLLHFKYPPSA